MSSQARYVITGMSGGLGRALASRLPPPAIVAVDRVEPPPGTAGCFVPGDIRKLPWPDLVVRGDTVFHLAATVHSRPGDEAAVRQTYEVNTESTIRLAAACREAGALLVFVSTVAVFGTSRAGGIVALDAEPRPETDYAQSKLLAENAIREAGQRGLDYVIVRFPLLYGPHGRGNMERMLRAIGRRAYLPMGDQAVRKSTLYFSDAADALVRAARATEARGHTFVAAPRNAPTLGQIHAAAYAAMGRWCPPPLAAPVARLGASVVDVALRLAGRPAGLRAQVETLTSPAWFDGSTFAAVTGFEPAISLEEGLARTAAWLLGEGVP